MRASNGGGELSGKIAIDGSSTVAPFAEAAAELFQEENPDVQITVGTSGTGGGFEKFCAGETDVSDASRPIKDDEEAPLCEEGGVKYTEIQVANDGIAVATSKELAVDCLTTDQLKQIWNKGSKVKSLADVDPELPDTELSLYGPGTDSGTFDFFTDEINGEEGVSREDYEASEDDNQLVTGVAGDQGGLGYFGFSYYEGAADTLNLVGVDRGDGNCVKPSVESIQDGSTSRSPARCSCTRRQTRWGGPRSRRSWSSSPTRRRRSQKRPRSSRSPTSRHRPPRTR